MHSGNEVDREQDEASANKGIYKTHHRVGKLICKLDVIVVEPASGDNSGAIKMCDIIRSKEAGEEITDEASDAVDAENVEAR